MIGSDPSSCATGVPIASDSVTARRWVRWLVPTLGVLLLAPLAYDLLADLALGSDLCSQPGTDVPGKARWQVWPPGAVCVRGHRGFTPAPTDRVWQVVLAALGLLLLVAWLIGARRRQSM